MTLSPKENYLAAITFNGADYVPRGNEDIVCSFQFAGNFRGEDWTDLWGVSWEVGLPDTVPFPKVNPLPSLDRLSEYRFPSPADLVLTEKHKDRLAQVDRGAKLVIGQLTYLLFERAWAVMGMENLLLSLITHPREAHAFLHQAASFARGVFDRYLELGVDGVGFTEDLGSQRALMMAPSMFREFFLPEYIYMFENVRKAGKLVAFHSCGCVQDIAPDLASIGVSVLNPIQQRANDIGRIKRETMGRLALEGAIDTELLFRGTPEDVRREVIRVMEILKPGGGYICRPDQVVPGIPAANMAALWAAAEEAGRY